jgi:hypothetical protein
MTHGALIEYILANDCYIYKEVANYYKFRKNGSNRTENMSGLPKTDSKTEVLPFTVCQVCHNLGIPVPPEVKFAEEVINIIREKHINDSDEQSL